MQPSDFIQPLRQHLIALISLTVALSSLSYNTWRNERTEANRNVRVAAFEELKTLGELQALVNHAYFGQDASAAVVMTGWSKVALIADLAELLPGAPATAGQELTRVWAQHADALLGEAATDAITRALDASRSSVLTRLRALN